MSRRGGKSGLGSGQDLSDGLINYVAFMKGEMAPITVTVTCTVVQPYSNP